MEEQSPIIIHHLHHSNAASTSSNAEFMDCSSSDEDGQPLMDAMEFQNRELAAELLKGQQQQQPPQKGSSAILSKEEEVARLLSEMRDGSYSNPTSPAPPPTPSFDPARGGLMDSEEDSQQHTFISRVSKFPVVNSTIKTIGDVYESGKNSSGIIRYSAETVESSVKTIIDNTKPILSRFEPSLEQLDNFACKQLDKFERTFTDTTDVNMQQDIILDQAAHRLQSPSTQLQQPSADFQQQKQSSGVLSRWNEYISAESLRSLQFCVDWLRYAISHIDAQIHVLRSGMAQIMHNQSSSAAVNALANLAAAVRREVVETMRKIVDVMGRYAGIALPGEARNLVRGFILSFPSRWQSVSNETSEQHEAQRVIQLAEESNRILTNTKTVFDQSQRAAEYFFGGPSNDNAAVSSPPPPQPPSSNGNHMQL